MTQRLFVHYQLQTVGDLTLMPSGRMQFEYRNEWRQSAGGFPVSLSLPLDGSFDIEASHHFFVNLLPEANVRQQICQSLKISPDNDFELLKAIGGDCAGALAITESDEPIPPDNRFEPISDRQLSDWSVGTPLSWNEFPSLFGSKFAA